MIYDAPCSLPGASFAHLPIFGLEDLVPGMARRPTAARGSRSTPVAAVFHTCIPACTACVAGERAPDARHRPRQIPGAKISVCHGVGGMFAASGTIIMSNESP